MQRAGKTTIFGGGNNPISFVSAEDVARFGVIALEDSTARNRTIDVGGPEKLTFNQAAEIYERISGRQAAKSHVPLPTMRVMRVVMRPFNPMLSFQITGGILMDTEDQTCDMSATLREYPMKLKRLEDVALELAGRLQGVRFQPAN